MPLPWEQIEANALHFAKKWSEREGKERQQAQMFVRELLLCFGIDDPLDNGEFERPCKKEFGDDGYIDYFSPTRIIIEMKTKGRGLKKADEQIKNYVLHLLAEDMPALIMICDFENIILTHRTTGKQKTFKIKSLYRNVREFANIAGYKTTRTYDDEIDVNVKAAEKMAMLHDAIKNYGYEGHKLEVYLVRLLFCLFAEDTGIFQKSSFVNFVENSLPDGTDLSIRLGKLFEVLNLSKNERAKRKNLPAEMSTFCYINGGLFADILPTPDFDAKMRKTLLECCSFDWSKISPAIFGAMFQGVMDKKQRRELGAHYTSEENILKLINPLFLDDLWEEFDKVKTTPKLLDKFHSYIANLKFLDPACGCGNFLILTYRELRKLEIEILKMRHSSTRKYIAIETLLKVKVEQFYGIEYEEFPCQIAQVGMWLMDHQMNLRVAEEFGEYYVRLPLTQGATIKHANAIRIDWEDLIPKNELNYIIGNPPFVGARIMSQDQKSDLLSLFENTKNAGNLDYVCCWYKKAADFMRETTIQAAFVSTNSICQGEQVANLWKPLFESGVFINFAYRTFRWNNEARGKAAVLCIIVAFSFIERQHKEIFTEELTIQNAKNINGYLCDAPNICVESRQKPICDVPSIGIGSQPIDDGNYLFTKDEKEQFIACEPNSAKWFRPWIGSVEFINGFQRYCLFLQNCPPSELKKMPEALKRINAVKQFRLKSTRTQTKKIADTPLRFQVENFPDNDYIVIPEVSSERREYIPMGFVSPDILSSNLVKIVSKGTLYHFGILTSNMHNHWMRAVGGRLKSDYRYSKDIVYNNFPWPDADEKQIKNIEKLGQAVLDARKLFPESSLADLYDPLTMPVELRKAHQSLDKAVMKLYGFSTKMSEADCVAKLLEKYQNILMGK